MEQDQVVNYEAADDNDVEGELFDDETRCKKLQWPDNILAYIEKRELDRDVEIIKYDQSLVEKVTTNYVIAKKIISSLSWQEKMLCKHVCTTWRSAVHTLYKEQLNPADFVMDLQICAIRGGIKYKKSSNFCLEPLVVLTFANTAGFTITSKCEVIVPCPCEPTCDKEHSLLDVVQRHVSAPKDCMFSVKASYISYMPLPQSLTYEHTVTHNMFLRSNPFISGIYIPAIPNVKFQVINVTTCSTQNDFFEAVSKLSHDYIFKGVLVYVTESFLLHSVEDIVFLNHIKDVQPDIPYALGGCIVEDTICKESDIKALVDCANDGSDYISVNLVSIGMFMIPKSTNEAIEGDKNNFDMYSLIIESSDWAKAKIQKTINEFAKKVPHFEYSVAIKLSCVGRDQKHELEQDYFRAAFPNTRIVGCYGNGELGVNHPVKAAVETAPNAVKRHRRDPGPQGGIMYSYSTVFVYIGWGKILSSPVN